jgi:hypothetical protein
MRNIGFCTGGLALSDFRLGLDWLRKAGITTVELSAMRVSEFDELFKVFREDSSLLDGFEYISVHAPKFGEEDEKKVSDQLGYFAEVGFPIVIHPQFLYTTDIWRQFGNDLCIENMDQRAYGQTKYELKQIFKRFSEASFCFAIGHTRQLDPSMDEGRKIIKTFNSKCREVHISEVRPDNKHITISPSCAADFKKISNLIPENDTEGNPTIIIIESMIPFYEIKWELDIVKDIFA